LDDETTILRGRRWHLLKHGAEQRAAGLEQRVEKHLLRRIVAPERRRATVALLAGTVVARDDAVRLSTLPLVVAR
jgi:hypothetical protein